MKTTITYGLAGTQMRAAYLAAACCAAAAAASPNSEAPAPESPAEAPRIVNIINFIRGIEPRTDVDLLLPVAEQIRLLNEHGLPATFLIQYDAMQQERFVSLLRDQLADACEIGGWLEVVQPLVEEAGIPWRGRYPWDWHSHVGFAPGYTPAERERIVDVFMAGFEKTFGRLPKSMGSWFMDAHTLGYLADRYGVAASCNCKDQLGTDGYTLWGGYWNQAYYPSRVNALMPAQHPARQIPIPVFRMLGSDPIYQYDANRGTGHQSVVSLEPVYKDGGGSPQWVRWFFRVMTDAPCGAFAYAQAGQENAFGWPAMGEGLTDQFALLAELAARGAVRVETLEASARWFRERFPVTPATSVVALEDWQGEGRRSVWYNCRHYRANLFWENGGFRIRDIHRFDEAYPERYLTQPVTTPSCVYDTLPVVDGNMWSSAETGAGMYAVAADEAGRITPLTGGEPSVDEPAPGELRIAWPAKPAGTLTVRLREDGIGVYGAGLPNWALALLWSPDKTPPVVSAEQRAVSYEHNGFAYRIEAAQGRFERVAGEPRLMLLPEEDAVELRFGGQ
ncbi:MAG: hypothetical protein JXR94_13190 [Candidatus Hydrogenedentes bacterium]|nr:hypothetical protein [Candidatus Hydrogenedentota bacterium]